MDWKPSMGIWPAMGEKWRLNLGIFVSTLVKFYHHFEGIPRRNEGIYIGRWLNYHNLEWGFNHEGKLNKEEVEWFIVSWPFSIIIHQPQCSSDDDSPFFHIRLWSGCSHLLRPVMYRNSPRGNFTGLSHGYESITCTDPRYLDVYNVFNRCIHWIN